MLGAETHGWEWNGDFLFLCFFFRCMLDEIEFVRWEMGWDGI